MPMTDDPVAINQWIACSFPGEIAPGHHKDTVVLGQPVRIRRLTSGGYDSQILADGRPTGKRVPVLVRFDLVFVSLGDAPRPLPTIAEFEEPGRRVFNCGGVRVRTSPFRIIENFLDMAHFCFVHTDVLGVAGKTEVLAYKCQHRADSDEIWATDCQFFQPSFSATKEDEGGGRMARYTYRVMSPFSVMLYKTSADYDDLDDAIAVFIQPQTETDCIAYMTQALIEDNYTTAELIGFQHAIFLQDRIILENQRPALLSFAPHSEIPTKADLSSVAFRRWLKASGIRFGTVREQA
jgi:phenylpropionate dioxygenase-like ring-hydroxylating dioxygenase large terminal subunit